LAIQGFDVENYEENCACFVFFYFKFFKNLFLGLKAFTSDSNKLAHPLTKVQFIPCKTARKEWKEETEAFLNYSFDRAMTAPKGISIEEKAYHILNKVIRRPKGIKISSFPEAFLQNDGEEAINLITNISTRPVKKKSKTAKDKKPPVIKIDKQTQDGNRDSLVKNLNDLDKKEVNLTFDQEKAASYANTNNIMLNSTLSKEEINDSKVKVSYYWRDFFKNEDSKIRKTTMDRYSKIFHKYKLDENLLLEKLTNFPMLSRDDVINNKNLYTETERQLIDKFLFEKLENSEENLAKPVEKHFLPTVTKIIEFSRSDQLNEALLKWKIEKVERLGLQGFYEDKKKTFREGTELHQFIEQCLKSLGQENLEAYSTSNNAIHSELERIIKLDFKNVQLIESEVIHRNLFYQGKIDCLAYYKGDLCLIDWKTSEKNKSELRDLYDIPVQLSGYLGAFFNDPTHDSLRKKHVINYGLIVNINKSKEGNINFHLLNHQLSEFFWHQWLVALKKFWISLLKEKNASHENIGN
jgi:hypothetical protein